MTPAKLIHRFNLINGNALSLATAKELHGQVQKAIDHDSHGPYAKPLREVYNKLATFMKKLSAQNATGAARVEFDKVEYHPGIGIRDLVQVGRKELGKVESKKLKVVKPEKADETMLHGLQCIQKDADYQGQPLGAIGDTTYKVITDKILSLIQKDGLIWRKPWNTNHAGKESHAHNYVTKTYYRGANFYLNYLLMSDFESPYFFTYRQVDQLGGKVKAGSKGWPVIYFKWLYKKQGGALVEETEATANGKLKPGYEKFPGLFYYTVFNHEQTEGVKVKPFKKVTLTLKEKIESCETIVSNMPQRPPIKNVSGDRAFYTWNLDVITMPLMEQFKQEQEYYCTLFHEMIHSTGDQKRVGRVFGRKGTKAYAFEELIAELGASFLCGESGIFYFTMNNSAAYIKGWSKSLVDELTADNKFFVKAAAAAEKASEFILDRANADKKKKPVKKLKVVRSTKPATANRKPATKPKVVKQPAKQPVASNQQPVAVTKSLSGVTYQYYALPLGEFEPELYKVNSDSNAMFWGKPGHGKTVKMLKLAQHFAEQGKKVHYISEEEYGKSTFDEKLNEHNIGHANLTFSGELNESDIAASEIVFFDSVNTLQLKPLEVKALDKKYPNRLFVLIVQTTKDGQFRGGRDWEHLVDVAGEISNRKIILHKNRFDKENPEKMNKLMTEDAIAEATKRYRIRSAVKANVQPSKSTLTI